MDIRPLDAETAEGAAELARALQPGVLTTAAYLLHREATTPERAQRLAVAAVDGDVVVGWASVGLKTLEGSMDDARLWVGVSPAYRGRGIGAELAARVEDHAAAAGAKTLSTLVDDDEAGMRFAGRRGYRESGGGIVSVVEPRPVSVPARPGLEIATLAELRGAERELYRIWGEAGAFPPSAAAQPSFEEWRRMVLENPVLEPEGSFNVVADGRPVALAWLLLDRERRRAEHEWTATLPELRGRGLARLAKLHVIRWAAENGVPEILTESDEGNVAMLELNGSLGYRRLWRRTYLKRPIA
jgi:GNAT superfamily N-acetyltransferase